MIMAQQSPTDLTNNTRKESSESGNIFGCLNTADVIIGGVLLLLSLFAFFFGQSGYIRCTRKSYESAFNCTIENKAFFFFKTSQLLGVVVNGVSSEQKCNFLFCTSRILLMTSTGSYPLTESFSLGSKAESVDQLNAKFSDHNRLLIEFTDDSGSINAMVIGGILLIFVICIVLLARKLLKRG
jgi:hypothetical protein